MLSRSVLCVASVMFLLAAMCVSESSAQMIQGIDTRLGGANSITGTVITTEGGRVTSHIGVRLVTNTRGNINTTTDDFGNFAFRGVPSGDYMIVIDKAADFEAFSTTVSVIQPRGFPPQSYTISCRLKPKPGILPLKPVVLNAELAGVPKTALDHYNKGVELAGKADHAPADQPGAAAARTDRLAAIEQFKLAIDAHPKFSAAYNDMGVQYLKINDVAAANDAFRTAVNLAPDAFAPLLNLGMLMVDIQKFGEAEKVLRAAIAAKEGSAPAHYYLGRALANLGKFDDAIVELNKGLTLGGEAMAHNMKEAYRILAIMYSSKGEKKRAAAQLEKYLELNPNAPDAEQLRRSIEQFKAGDGGSAASTTKPPGS